MKALVAAIGLILASPGASPGASMGAGAQPVDLELALGIDVSGSIDQHEARLQRDGYIAAFRDADVIAAIGRGVLGKIAVVYFEWAGYGHMKIIVPWSLIEDRASAAAFATELEKTPPQTARRTAISAAIRFAVPFFDYNRFEGTKRVLDLSGDGPNNWGGPVRRARDTAVRAGVTINGLPIVNDRLSPFGTPSFRDLDLYYRDCVIGGPGAFIVVARNFPDFARAVRRKLILEIAGRAPAADRTRAVGVARSITVQARRVSPPCDAGERRRRSIEDF